MEVETGVRYVFEVVNVSREDPLGLYGNKFFNGSLDLVIDCRLPLRDFLIVSKIL